MSKKYREKHWLNFGDHTVLKHGVVDRYVKAWIQILKTSHPVIWVVDGFAGKGMDQQGKPGSPLLFARSAAGLRAEGKDVRLIAIEPKLEWFESLKATLAPYDAEASGAQPVAFLRRGTLLDVAEEALGMIGSSPTFVFLDPFGADGLALSVVKRILSLPKGEIFALFSQSAVCRHLAVLAAPSQVDRTLRAAMTMSPTLFPELEAQWLEEDLSDAQESDASALPTREAAQRILVDLFGSLDEVQRILALPAKAWANEVVGAYVSTLRRNGASYVTPFAVFDEDERCVYYLIHAANAPLARIKMKEAVAAGVNKSELSDGAKRGMRSANAGNLVEAVASVVRAFSGRTVRWAKQGKGESVREFALGETELSVDQLPSLQQNLLRYKKPGRAIVYEFPMVNE